MGKTHEDVFPGVGCLENFRVLSETFLRVSPQFATFFMDFTQ